METTHTVSVIICAYTQERWDALVAAIDSVKRQVVQPQEIIVVIDHNPPLLKQARTQYSGCTVVGNAGPRGLSGARNTGIAVARGELIAFLDDDALAAPTWLQKLCEPFADAAVLGVGGVVHPRWQQDEPTWFPEEFYWVVGCTYRGMPQKSAVIRNPIGANMCLRREVFEVVGGFRSEIGRVGTRPIGCEETELCIRANNHWPERVFLYQPLASVEHCVPSTRANWHYFWSRCYAEGLSKAVVTHYVGAKDSLASESTYTRETLPRGVVRNLAQAVSRGTFAGITRAGAITAGLVVTATGYCIGRIFSDTSVSTANPAVTQKSQVEVQSV